MVATSRPSLRSSSRRTAGLAKSLPTAIHHQNTPILPTTQRAKRARRSSSINNEAQSIKRPRIQLDVTSKPQSTTKRRNTNTFAQPANEPSHDVVSLTVTSHVTNGVSPTSTECLPDTAAQDVASYKITTAISKSNATVSTQQVDKRTLRSQGGGSRLRSELSVYFPNYDEIISDEPREPGKQTRSVISTVVC